MIVILNLVYMVIRYYENRCSKLLPSRAFCDVAGKQRENGPFTGSGTQTPPAEVEQQVAALGADGNESNLDRQNSKECDKMSPDDAAVPEDEFALAVAQKTMVTATENCQEKS